MIAVGCSLCSPRVEPGDGASLVSRAEVTCGLCGGVVVLTTGELPECESCGERIRDTADGVKLCDGKIVHAVCRPR